MRSTKANTALKWPARDREINIGGSDALARTHAAVLVLQGGRHLLANVHDVAAYILGKAGSMTATKLQKLLFYSQAWSLGWDEEPLFPDRIDAGANGPVVRKLYRRQKGTYTVRKWGPSRLDRLTKNQQEPINAVLGVRGARGIESET